MTGRRKSFYPLAVNVLVNDSVLFMSGKHPTSGPAIRGTIRRRLLVNAVVDPDEAAARLPGGVRPHVTAQGAVVGCCLLEIDAIRPGRLPELAGRPLRAAAHRISAEWDDPSGATVTGVYVPVRHTDSHLAVAIGGRWFPGVHERARIEVSASGARLRWTSAPLRDAGRFGVRVAVSVPIDARAGEACCPVGTTCLAATIGLSPDHHGVLEAARMEPAHRDACAVVVDELDSAFIAGFTTATLSTSYLMRDVDVVWTRAVNRRPVPGPGRWPPSRATPAPGTSRRRRPRRAGTGRTSDDLPAAEHHVQPRRLLDHLVEGRPLPWGGRPPRRSPGPLIVRPRPG
jgi:hypothetical protein